MQVKKDVFSGSFSLFSSLFLFESSLFKFVDKPLVLCRHVFSLRPEIKKNHIKVIIFCPTVKDIVIILKCFQILQIDDTALLFHVVSL